MTIPFVHHPWLAAAGLGLLVVGYLMRRWAARHNLIDMAKDSAIGAAMASVRSGKVPTIPQEIAGRFDAVAAEKTNLGRAKSVAGMAVRGYLAMFIGFAGWIALLCGLGLIVAAVLIK
jgi:hypothetical protein